MPQSQATANPWRQEEKKKKKKKKKNKLTCAKKNNNKEMYEKPIYKLPLSQAKWSQCLTGTKSKAWLNTKTLKIWFWKH